MKKFTCILIAWLAVCFVGVSSVALADWDLGDGHKMHHPQTPKFGGLGVEFNGLTSMADDFLCTQTGDITDIHIWVAWKGNVVEPITSFSVTIWSDIPATENSHSMPGEPLWDRTFTAGEFVVRDMQDDSQGWFDPAANQITPFDHWQWQQINITDIINPFEQFEGTIYWLMFNFNDMDPIGWKETDQNYNDAAVWYDLSTSQWRPLINPDTGQNIDLAFVINYVEPAPLDYGDAPDTYGIGTYPTERTHNGARHIPVGPWLGGPADAPDQEPDGQPNATASGDDGDGFDDENGVTFPVALVPGYLGSVIFEVNGASAGANVDGWVDFNADNLWDASEQIVSGTYANGIHSAVFLVPAGATLGQTFSRFRISTDANVFGSTVGKAQDGEVEDHAVTIDQGPQGLDFGDAPEPYPTMLPNGARHVMIGVPWLGGAADGPDAETNGQPAFLADGDDTWDLNDDENGVVMPAVMNQGALASITIEVSGGGGVVDAWIDWNFDQIWDLSEQIHNAYLPNGIHTITVVPPSGGGLGQTYARFRISSTGGLWPDGLAQDGEVEDYAVVIEPGPEDYDLGDAPDSANSFSYLMTAYSDGTPASYPTVFGYAPPYGPRHAAPKSSAWLGIDATREDEADIGVDQDGINNIDPLSDLSNRDGADDGLVLPVKMPRCKKTTVTYEVTVADPSKPYYVNIWCDFDRDGDWDDQVFGCAQDAVPEWAVRNQLLDGLPTGTFSVTSLPFVSWHPANGPDELWMRITISEQPWQEIWGAGGCGPDSGIGYTAGETEDYLVTPDTSCVECADLNCSGLVDLADFAIFASQWLGTCP